LFFFMDGESKNVNLIEISESKLTNQHILQSPGQPGIVKFYITTLGRYLIMYFIHENSKLI